MNRRKFFQFGGVSLFSAGLMHILASRTSAQPPRQRAKACILLFQVGGPYQAETFDPKPNASAEIRGIFRTIQTRVPGLLMTDALPRVAEHADKLTILRGVNHTIRCHNPAIYCSIVGREATDPMAVSNRTNARRTDHPHFASVVARLRPPRTSMPFHVIIPNTTNNGPAKSPGLLGGYLGAAYDPFVLGADPNSPDFRIESLDPPTDVDSRRFAGRQSLLQRFDRQQRIVERTGAVDSMHTLYRRAFNMLTDPASKVAFDLSRESDRVRDRYGRHTQGQSALLARRLVEVGVPFVSVFSHVDVDRGSWDTHQNHNTRVREQLLPPADQSFSALLEDLHTRGLLDETLVIWMGEFGRTPRMGVNFSNNTNNVTGRDHWCNCYSVVLAGGGVRGGNVVGSSDQFAAYPRERAVHVSELAATIFHLLGIDPRAQLYDIQGQFHTICDGNPVMEAMR
ncbi:MAG: DUF1501 domain-containing protein [Planctomycetes bacterium]|nr:DUF1501 domain-containing protein [Planctomycetota bacterium]